MIKLEDIKIIRKAQQHNKGYEIVFSNNRIIWLIKRRTIIALLLLIKYQVCSEKDLTAANNRLIEIKKIIDGKYKAEWILNSYSDANKPFSELWTEEGFSCIYSAGLKGNQQYVLNPEDHELLFNTRLKSNRAKLSSNAQKKILEKQHYKCNICGSQLKVLKDINRYTFAKDRVKQEFDHKIPIDKGGTNNLDNYQALCHYCNKCKRQICFICNITCSDKYALVNPTMSKIILATGENIEDRMG